MLTQYGKRSHSTHKIIIRTIIFAGNCGLVIYQSSILKRWSFQVCVGGVQMGPMPPHRAKKWPSARAQFELPAKIHRRLRGWDTGQERHLCRHVDEQACGRHPVLASRTDSQDSEVSNNQKLENSCKCYMLASKLWANPVEWNDMICATCLFNRVFAYGLGFILMSWSSIIHSRDFAFFLQLLLLAK